MYTKYKMGASGSKGFGSPQNEQRRQIKRTSQITALNRMSPAARERALNSFLTQQTRELRTLQTLNQRLNASLESRRQRILTRIANFQKQLDVLKRNSEGRNRILNAKQAHVQTLRNRRARVAKRQANRLAASAF